MQWRDSNECKLFNQTKNFRPSFKIWPHIEFAGLPNDTILSLQGCQMTVNYEKSNYMPTSVIPNKALMLWQCFKWANPGLFLFIFILSKHKFYSNNFRLQRDITSDHWTRRQALWPFDHHHGSCDNFWPFCINLLKILEEISPTRFPPYLKQQE